jgi:hypothetical protein
MQTVYELIYEDLTHLGGPMGTEYTTEQSLGLFYGDNAIQKAKAAAQKNYHGDEKIIWSGFKTQDLGYVMYHIKLRKIN